MKLTFPLMFFFRCRYGKFFVGVVLPVFVLMPCLCVFAFAGTGEKRDEPQKVVLHSITRTGAGASAAELILKDDYGFVLLNAGDVKNPVLKIIFGSKKDNRVEVAATWPEAEKIIAKIPAGSLIFEYDTCTMPRSYGLPEETREKLSALFAGAKIKVSHEKRLTCYCAK